MKEKVITLKPKGISQKQWSNLLLEFNLVKRAWKPYGVDLQISAPGLKNVLKWGTESYGKPERNGPHNIKRRIVSVSAVNRADDGTYIIIGKSRLLRPMRHTKIKTNNFC